MKKISLEEREELEKKFKFKINSDYLYEGDDIYDINLLKKTSEVIDNILNKNGIAYTKQSGSKIFVDERHMLSLMAISNIVQLRFGYCCGGWDGNLPKYINENSLIILKKNRIKYEIN